jgi:hypothetical protein
VAVKDSHFDSLVLPLKADGLPKSEWSFASASQSAQESPSSLVPGLGGDVIDPRLEDAVIDPLVTKTKSSDPTANSRCSPPQA